MNPEMMKVAFVLIMYCGLVMKVSSKPHPNSNNGAGNGMKEKVDALQAKVFELEEQEAETLSFQAELVENIHECQDNLTDAATYAQSKIDYLRRNLDIANNILEQSWYPKGKHNWATICEPRREKTCLRGVSQSGFQTGILSYRDYLENRNFTCSKFTYKTLQKWNNKGADQSARMRRLVCACVVRKPPKKGFLASRPMWYPSMSYFDKCRLRRACNSYFKALNLQIMFRQ